MDKNKSMILSQIKQIAIKKRTKFKIIKIMTKGDGIEKKI